MSVHRRACGAVVRSDRRMRVEGSGPAVVRRGEHETFADPQRNVAGARHGAGIGIGIARAELRPYCPGAGADAAEG